MSRLWGIPIMLALLGLIFYITVVGANIPSAFLSRCFGLAEAWLWNVSRAMPMFVRGLVIRGMFKTLGWVVSVMLPPMAVFFPLFTLLEDIGYLPRIAFVLDGMFKRAGAHGKMVLTICMGFGCNAVGVTAARIIESPRERLIAIITNSFIPCNGRFSSIIMLATIFASSVGGALGELRVTAVVLACVAGSVLISLVLSFILTKTVLKGVPSSFVMELPPYRKPRILSILYRSLVDRTMFVFGRAVVVAAPAGAVIWLMQNVYVGDNNIVYYISNSLNGFAGLMGLDGKILTAFIMGIPANEIVLPLIAMFYSGVSSPVAVGSASGLGDLLLANGWSVKTAVCTLIFVLCHFPCSTTLLTIKKETGSNLWTAVAFALPLVCGVVLCCMVNVLFSI
jgi:ferrous iron transport protein B